MPIKRLIPICALFVLGAAFLRLDSLLPDDPDRSPQRLSGARQSMRMWTDQRMYPAKDFPAEGLAAAHEFAKSRMPEDPGKNGSQIWEEMGPHNIGGRTLALAFNPENPQTLWAGSASGGLWRSYTAGVGEAAWERVKTGYPVLGVSSIAICEYDSNHIFIGTGEMYNYHDTQGGIAVRHTRGSYGMGILMSPNGGQDWIPSLDWSYDQGRAVQVVRIDPTNRLVVWAGTSEGTYKTTDGGVGWTRVHDVRMANDLVIHPEDPDIVVVVCGNAGLSGHGIYRTDDGGLSWTKIDRPGHVPAVFQGKGHIGLCAADPDVMMISLGNGDFGPYGTWLLRSEDAGVSWTLVNTEDYSRWQGWFSHDVAISPWDPDLVFAAGIDIWRSQDGGTTLTQVSDAGGMGYGYIPIGGPEGTPTYSHADHHDIVFHPTDPNTVYFANDGGVFRTTDLGNTYEVCVGGYQSTQFYAKFSCSPHDRRLCIGGLQDNSTVITRGTKAWYRYVGGDGSCTAVDPDDADVLYGSYQYLNIVKSIDGGYNWAYAGYRPSGGTGFIAPFALGGPGQSQTIYYGTRPPRKSLDGGVTAITLNGYLPLDNNLPLAVAVSQTDADKVYYTTAPTNARAGVFVTEDGASFTNITGDLPDRYPVGLAIDPNDDDVVYVTFAGYGTSHLFRSRDAGGAWEDLGAGLPDVPALSVIVDPLLPDRIYVGTDIGVFFSRNDGATWLNYNQGMPEAAICMDLAISPIDEMLRVATYGNGVYERPLSRGGTTDAPVAAATGARIERVAPNPFNPSGWIVFSLDRPGRVGVEIFDVAGRLVRRLAAVDRRAGSHRVMWDGRDDAGSAAASGVYICRLSGVQGSDAMRMTLLR